MERLKERMAESIRAWRMLNKALLVRKPSILERDGAIQRFEFTFESVWKTSQLYLKEAESITANSPKACIRTLGETGILSETETIQALAMANDRNLTAHTYIESVAKHIYGKLKKHAVLLRDMLIRMQEKAGLPLKRF
ncbi:MAG: nucleotidyltransferase substrate binding protein [Elusimicrobia bacterium]|nr:nucleotidyltransferase substrate binding protein [Elusimicrobiota bacterium]